MHFRLTGGTCENARTRAGGLVASVGIALAAGRLKLHGNWAMTGRSPTDALAPARGDGPTAKLAIGGGDAPPRVLQLAAAIAASEEAIARRAGLIVLVRDLCARFRLRRASAAAAIGLLDRVALESRALPGPRSAVAAVLVVAKLRDTAPPNATELVADAVNLRTRPGLSALYGFLPVMAKLTAADVATAEAALLSTVWTAAALENACDLIYELVTASGHVATTAVDAADGATTAAAGARRHAFSAWELQRLRLCSMVCSPDGRIAEDAAIKALGSMVSTATTAVLAADAAGKHVAAAAAGRPTHTAGAHTDRGKWAFARHSSLRLLVDAVGLSEVATLHPRSIGFQPRTLALACLLQCAETSRHAHWKSLLAAMAACDSPAAPPDDDAPMARRWLPVSPSLPDGDGDDSPEAADVMGFSSTSSSMLEGHRPAASGVHAVEPSPAVRACQAWLADAVVPDFRGGLVAAGSIVDAAVEHQLFTAEDASLSIAVFDAAAPAAVVARLFTPAAKA